MKKTVVSLSWVLAFFLLVAVAAAAAGNGGFRDPAATGRQGGFYGPSTVMTSVEKAMTLPDDAHVVLHGSIVRHISKDRYEFRDATGTIVVEIDSDKWAGQTITPEDTVELRGEVDRDRTSVKIDVDRVARLQ